MVRPPPTPDSPHSNSAYRTFARRSRLAHAVPSLEAFLPLTPLTLSVLVALGERPRNGYALINNLEALEVPALVSGAGSLYGALDRLTESGLLTAAEDLGDPRRRRRFSVTELGRRVAPGRLQESAGD